ncbi:MAG: hypothetical protein B6D34_04795 [Candidatus Brocadia sp. UTAMX1]|jgi:hypothetical protein|nr:MAG: hypothetical protein B6D34_04795 [Candidatus Brocadia sp. UTAMX1]
MNKRYWHIQGYDGLELIFETKVPAGYLSEERVKIVLQTLVARAGLDYDEIVGALVRRKTKGANGLLDVSKNGPYPQYSCGDNPHFHARVVDE